jgi:nucleolar protein 4
MADKGRKREHDDTKHKSSKPPSDEPSRKKRRVAPSGDKVEPKAEPAATQDAPKKKPANPLGSLIGRKRKQRKSGNKGKK